jgi:type IX secretion system PorP/SprF family membrane protein
MPKLRLYVLLVLSFLLYKNSIGQQRVHNSQYYFNQYHDNPAYGGLDRSLSITSLYKSQWNGLNSSPEMIYIGAHMPMYIWKGAIGVEGYVENFGIFNNSYFTASYNHVVVNSIGLFSLGLRLGIHNTSIDGASIQTPEGVYGTGGNSNHNDPSLSLISTSGISPLVELGAYFDNKMIKAGASLQQFPEFVSNIENSKFNNTAQLKLFFQYNMILANDLIFKPTVSMRSDFIHLQTDINALVEINGNIFGGIGVRGYNSTSLDAVGIMGGLNINNNYRFSYQFDVNLSELKRVNEGSHEIILNYNLNKPIATGLPPRVIFNARDL